MDKKEELMGEFFKTSYVYDAVEMFIAGLEQAHRAQGDERDWQDIAYVRILMAANAAYRDGVALELAGYINVFATLYMRDGNLEGLPSEIKKAMEKFKIFI